MKKVYLIVFFCLFFIKAHSGIILLPMSSGGGSFNENDMISVLITANLFFIIYYLLRLVIFLFIKNNIDRELFSYIFLEKIMFDMDMKIGIVMFVSICINSIALFCMVSSLIFNLLN